MNQCLSAATWTAVGPTVARRRCGVQRFEPRSNTYVAYRGTDVGDGQPRARGFSERALRNGIKRSDFRVADGEAGRQIVEGPIGRLQPRDSRWFESVTSRQENLRFTTFDGMIVLARDAKTDSWTMPKPCA